MSKLVGWSSTVRIDRATGIFAALYLALCLMLGGASGPGSGAIANGLLQGLAVLLILFCLWAPRDTPYPSQMKPLLWLAGLFVAAVILQLVPLPPGLWQQLAGREAVARGYELLGMEVPTLSLSLTPQNSLSSLMWVLPPIAMFLLVLQASVRERQRLAWVMLGVAVISIGLGAAQLLGGPDSSLRFYAITNRESPVGFFANVNNQAMLLLCALAFAGHLAARAARKEEIARQRGGKLLALGVGLFLVVGVGIAGSLAGYGLLLPAAFATYLIYRRAAFGPMSFRWLGGLSLLFVLFLGMALMGPINQQALAGKYGDEPTSRKLIAQNTIEAIGDYFPVGSGLGSFVDVYRRYENPYAIASEYVNHAHNDYLELVLELGAVGAVLIAVFLLWLTVQGFRVWTRDFEGAGLARAATIAAGILIMHSLVEFPLRTSALAAVMAMACALMIAPAPARHRRASGTEKLRHLEAV
jgi:O-antigen ligase